MVQLLDNIFALQIPLPDNPLKWLNCYIIKDQNNGRNLIIDTGFNRPECYSVLREAIIELDLDPQKTDVFISHLHADHSGNAHKLAALGYKLFMGRQDYEYLKRLKTIDDRKASLRDLLDHGMSHEELAEMCRESPSIKFAPESFEATLVDDGDILSYGGYKLTALLTPGHTPGHMCLYDPATETIFLGDHVLFDITPNICSWAGVEDSLGNYLHSLKKISSYKIRNAFPSHRNTSDKTVNERIEEIKNHHNYRLNELLKILSEEGPLSTYDLAGKMTWKIKTRDWASFPVGQKHFAVREAQAHAEHLIKRGLIKITVVDGKIGYTLT